MNILAWDNRKGHMHYMFMNWKLGLIGICNDGKERLGVFVSKPKRWNVWIALGQTTAKAFTKDVSINQERKLGDRRWSETVLVLTINDADQG